MIEIVSVGSSLYEMTLFSKRTPLDLSLFVGAFLAIQGLLSFQWLYSSFFCNCGEFINGFPVSFYENLIMLVGFVLYIGSISLMLLGVGGTENKFPSKHSILDFMFTLGPFIFFSGFIGLASWGGWSALLSVPLLLVGIEMTAVSSYYLRRDYTKNGEHVLAWELTFLVSLGWLLIILFATSSGMPLANPYTSPTEYDLMALPIIGMAIGAEGLWYTLKKKRGTKYEVISTTNVGRGGDLDKSRTINNGGRGKIFLFASLVLITILSLSWFIVGYYSNINNPCGGAFGFGGCNVKIIHLESGTLFSGPLPTSPTCSKNNSAYLFVALNNPSEATNISGVNITGYQSTTQLNNTVFAYYLKNISSGSNSNNVCTKISSTNGPRVNPNIITYLNIYFGGQAVSALVQNKTYSYVISFINGQSISGLLVAR